MMSECEESVCGLKVVTYNLWGVFNSKLRRQRMIYFASKVANYDVMLLQEQFSADDFELIKCNVPEEVRAMRYFRRFPSSFYGSGCAVISRYPISSTLFFTFPLQGVPEMILHGDFFANKGAALIKIEVPYAHTNNNDSCNNGKTFNVHLYTTHMVAVYEKITALTDWRNERYLPYRLSQAIALASFVANTSSPTDRVIVAGDFNSSQRSLEVKIFNILLKRCGFQLCSVLPSPENLHADVDLRDLEDSAVREQLAFVEALYTFSHLNKFNSMKTSYFKLLHIESDIPEQIDHIFYSKNTMQIVPFNDCPDVNPHSPLVLHSINDYPSLSKSCSNSATSTSTSATITTTTNNNNNNNDEDASTSKSVSTIEQEEHQEEKAATTTIAFTNTSSSLSEEEKVTQGHVVLDGHDPSAPSGLIVFTENEVEWIDEAHNNTKSHNWFVRGVKLLSPLSLITPVIRSVATFVLVDAFEWYKHKPSTSTSNNNQNNNKNKSNVKQPVYKTNIENIEKCEVKRDENIASCNTDTPLTVPRVVSESTAKCERDNYYPISDHYGVAAQFVLRSNDNDNDDDDDDVSDNRNSMCTCSQSKTVHLTEEELEVERKVICFLREQVKRLRRQAYLTRYVALCSLSLLILGVVLLYVANYRFVDSNTKILKDVYDLGSSNVTITQSLSTALDKPINNSELFGMYGYDTEGRARLSSTSLVRSVWHLVQGILSKLNITKGLSAQEHQHQHQHQQETKATNTIDFERIAEHIGVPLQFTTIALFTALSVLTTMISVSAFAIGMFQRSGNANVLEEQINNLELMESASQTK